MVTPRAPFSPLFGKEELQLGILEGKTGCVLIQSKLGEIPGSIFHTKWSIAEWLVTADFTVHSTYVVGEKHHF